MEICRAHPRRPAGLDGLCERCGHLAGLHGAACLACEWEALIAEYRARLAALG